MKNIFLLLLVLTVGCEKKSSGESTKKTSETVQTPVVPTTPVVPGTPSPVIPPVVKPPVVVPTPTLTWTDEFMELVNDHRRSLGLRALIHDESVAIIVRAHSQNMANGTVAFGHGGFSERCSASRKELGGGNWCGENVAMGQKSPSDAFKSWMNSPGHKANIENTRATHTGFGYAKNSSGRYYWTQIFLEL